MVLRIDSDAAYLVMPKEQSQIAGYYHLSHQQKKINRMQDNKNVVALAAESEIGGCFHNIQTHISIRFILIVLCHSQPPTLIKTDNITVHGFIHDNINLTNQNPWT